MIKEDVIIYIYVIDIKLVTPEDTKDANTFTSAAAKKLTYNFKCYFFGCTTVSEKQIFNSDILYYFEDIFTLLKSKMSFFTEIVFEISVKKIVGTIQ